MLTELTLSIPKQNCTVSALLDKPDGRSRAALTLAHGAGAGMTHSFLSALTSLLVARGLTVLRFQFPYWERGEKRPDSPARAAAAVAAAQEALIKCAPDLPHFAAGKSFGARMSTTAAAQGLLPGVRGIICYGFPLHPAGQPGVERAKHLYELRGDLRVPLLFLQGTRDALAEWPLITRVTGELPAAKLVEISGADHSFGVLKRSGRTAEEVLEELASATDQFISWLR